jgi:ABC-type glutathione transport system ATPase component
VTEPILDAAGITVTYPGRRRGDRHTAVNGVDLTVAPGEIVGLVGESGCGKSTFSRAVLGLQPLDRGSVSLAGVNLKSLTPRRLRTHRRLAQMVFQNPFSSLDPHVTILNSISEALAIHGKVARGDRQEHVAELLTKVGLDPVVANRRPRQLSGGECQRVAIARALAVEPRLLVCDEAVSALDVSVQARVLNLLMDLRDQLGMACLFITHDISVLAQLADRIAVMHDGQLVETGPAHDILTQPKHPQTQRLRDAIPVLSTQADLLETDQIAPLEPAQAAHLEHTQPEPNPPPKDRESL